MESDVRVISSAGAGACDLSDSSHPDMEPRIHYSPVLWVLVALTIGGKSFIEIKRNLLYFAAVTGAADAGARLDEHPEHEDGFQVFHEEFSRVETPYAVGLWIVVVALIKIGVKIFRIKAVKVIIRLYCSVS